jgi:hypothetical protein
MLAEPKGEARVICPTCRSEYLPGVVECAQCGVPLVERLAPAKPDEPWAVVAQHTLQIAWNPIDAAAFDLLCLEDALRDQGIESAFLPYRPGESGGFTDALRQPLQLLVRGSDTQRAREVAREVLGADCDMIV